LRFLPKKGQKLKTGSWYQKHKGKNKKKESTYHGRKRGEKSYCKKRSPKTRKNCTLEGGGVESLGGGPETS